MPNLDLRRDRELTSKSSKRYAEKVELYNKIRDGFRGQSERADDIMDFWKIYNCERDENNWYNGNSNLYVPIVHVAIEAIKTRTLNQLCPASGRYIDASSSDQQLPHAIVALLEDYVRQTKLRTQHLAALLRNGCVEGQYNLYCDWNRSSRMVVSRETIRPPMSIAGMPSPVDGIDSVSIEGITIEEVFDQHPTVEVLHDTDVLVRPQTANSIEDALRQGGDVTIIRRWTKETIEAMMEARQIVPQRGAELIEMSARFGNDYWRKADKELIDAAGIRIEDGGIKIFQVYETWKVVDVPGEGMRLTKSYYGGFEIILSDRLNPMWNDKCQLLSAPTHKIGNVFKGISAIKPGVRDLQYYANQIAQQAADSATYSMLPIVMTDPAKNPRTSTMLLNVGAVWEIDPNSTKFASFPPIWKDGIPIIQECTQQIFQALGVNPSMLPQQSGIPGRKRNQAEVAMEQQVDILSTTESASVVEDEILSPMVAMWAEYDHQFRDNETTVRTYGSAGHAANMEKVPLIQSTTRYHFIWNGVEQARNAAVNQQRIALLNVAMAPAMAQALQKNGKQIDPSPALEGAFGQLWGWREGRKIIVDTSALLAIKPEDENKMLMQHFEVPVHPMDQDPLHIQIHQQLLQHPDPIVVGITRDHMNLHMMQQRNKAMQQQMQQQQQLPQGGGGPAPPMQGGTAQGPRLVRGPPGAIHPDQMARAGAAQMPRKF